MTEEFVEIQKSRLNLLEGVAKLKDELWNDPKYGTQIKEMVKEKYPNANIPEVDMLRANRKVENDLLAKVEEKDKILTARIEAFEKAQKEKEDKDIQVKAEREFASQVEDTKSKYKLTAEGLEKVFARMKEKNNPDVEAAAAWVTDHEPKETPPASSPYSPQAFDLYGSQSGDKEWESLNKNPLAYGDRILTEMSNDFANGLHGKYKEFGGAL